MTVQLSIGLKNSMLVSGSARTSLTGVVIRIYSGVMPAAPDNALSGNTLLLEISAGGFGDGVTWESETQNGALLKAVSENWTGTVIADGVATFFRVVMPSDTGTGSTTAVRVQGTVGVINADLVVPSASLVTGTIQNINAGAFSLI